MTGIRISAALHRGSLRLDVRLAHAVAMLGVLSWQTVHIGRLITASGDRLESRINAVDARLGSRIDAVEAKLGSQIQVLDKDVQAILRHVFGDGRDRL